MQTIHDLTKEIETLLLEIKTQQSHKSILKKTLEELNNSAEAVKEQYNLCEEKIRTAKHQISQLCETSFLTVVK